MKGCLQVVILIHDVILHQHPSPSQVQTTSSLNKHALKYLFASHSTNLDCKRFKDSVAFSVQGRGKDIMQFLQGISFLTAEGNAGSLEQSQGQMAARKPFFLLFRKFKIFKKYFNKETTSGKNACHTEEVQRTGKLKGSWFYPCMGIVDGELVLEGFRLKRSSFDYCYQALEEIP